MSVRRDFVVFYKQTILGLIWHIIKPLFNILVLILIFGKLAKILADGIRPLIFYLSGTVAWRYSSLSLNQTGKTFFKKITNANMNSKTNNILDNSNNEFKKLENLIPFALVAGGGRSGTDLLQSLLDSHGQVLSFNGSLKFYIDFFADSKCLQSGSFDLIDLAHEFVGLYIERFNSKYDYIERKDQLGKDESESLNIDTQLFIEKFVFLLKNQEKNYKNILLGIHGAYHICLGNSFDSLKILFYHAHHFDEVFKFIEDFPTTTIVFPTRDPRAGFVSTIENWIKYDSSSKDSSSKSYLNYAHDNYLFFYFHLNRITEDEGRLVCSNKKHIIIRLEDLLNVDHMKSLSNLLFIDYKESMLLPTFGGKIWYGDRISGAKIRKFEWSENRTYNGWREKLSWRERYLITFMMHSKLKRNNYDYAPITIPGFLLVLILALAPFRYERRYVSISYLRYILRLNRLRALKYFLYIPLMFLKVRFFIIKYATIQLLNEYSIGKFKFIP